MNPDNAAVGRAFIMRAIFLYLPERSHLISALYRYAAPAEEAMIFLKAQNLLFIKPHKTASTSVEIALSCASTDPQDIITPLLPEDEEKRAAVGGKLPQNWAWLRWTEQRYLRDFVSYRETGRIPRRLLPGGHGKLYSKFSAQFYNHITPEDIQRRGGRSMLNSALVISMVRHPYEQIVSWAWHQKKLRKSDAALSVFLDEGLRLPSPNLPYLFGAKRPDHVIRYECMADDIARVSDLVNLDLISHMPLAKGGHRADRKQASEVLSQSQKEALFARDKQIFDAFGYQR